MILHSHQQCRRVPIFPHYGRHSLLFVFLTSHLVSVKWDLIGVLSCISVMTQDSMFFLSICISSLEKCLSPLLIFYLDCLFVIEAFFGY